MALAMAVPAVTGWYVHVNSFPPLHAEWDPRVGGARRRRCCSACSGCGTPRRSRSRCPGAACCWWCSSPGWRWMLALAFVDGSHGVSRILGEQYEYLRTARTTTDLHATLQEYVGRIRLRTAALAGAHRRPPTRGPDVLRGPRPGRAGQRLRRRDGGHRDRGDHRGRGAGHHARPRRRDSRAPGRAVPGARPGGGLAVGLRGRDVRRHRGLGGRLPRARGDPAQPRLVRPRRPAARLLRDDVLRPAPARGARRGGARRGAVMVPARPRGRRRTGGGGGLRAPRLQLLDALPAIHDRYYEGVGGRRPWAYWMWGDLAALAFSAGPLVVRGSRSSPARFTERAPGPWPGSPERVPRWCCSRTCRS